MSQGLGEYHQEMLAKTKERDSKVLELKQNNPQLSNVAIGLAFGISANLVGKILRKK